MELKRESSCFRERLFRTDLPPAAPLEALSEALRAEGWRDEARLDGLWRFVGAEGHEILIVTGTGRVQIRVHYEVPELERRWAAEAVFVSFARIVERLGASSR